MSEETWSEIVTPLVKTMDLAAALQQKYIHHDPKVLSCLIKVMAARLDGVSPNATIKLIEELER